MPAESGRRIAVGIGKETVRGTAVAPTYWLKHLEADFGQKARKEMNESSLNVLDKFSEAEIMEDFGAGKISGKVTDKAFPLLLGAAAGAVPVTTVNADASGTIKDHTITQSQANESLSLTIALKDQQRDERYAMGMLSSLEVAATVGDWVKFNADFFSKKPATITNTVAYVAENEFKAKHIVVKVASTVAGLGGAAAVALKDVKFTISRNVNPYYALGSNDPNNIFAQEVEVKGDFTSLFDSITHRDTFINNTYQAMSITMTNTDVVIGTAANPKLVFTFPRVTLSDWGTDQALGSIVEQTLGFQALYSLADGYAWNAVATNAVASY